MSDQHLRDQHGPAYGAALVRRFLSRPCVWALMGVVGTEQAIEVFKTQYHLNSLTQVGDRMLSDFASLIRKAEDPFKRRAS